MVMLRQLVTRNFKHLDVEITFPEGILAISGPNESGKSSIFEAILFALYGRTHKAPTGQKDRLINYDAKELYVKLTFEIDGTTYRIIRQIHRKRPSQAKLHKITSPGNSTLLATGVTNVDKEITSLLNGIALSDLLASNIVLQKDLDRLTKLQKMQRRDVINAMMGRDCYTRAVNILTDEIRPLKKTIQPEQQTLDELRRQKDTFHDNTKELTTKQHQLKQLETELKEISQIYAQTERQYKAVKVFKIAKDEQTNIQREIDHRNELVQRLADELSRLSKLKSQRRDLRSQQKKIVFLEEDITKFKKIQALKSELQSHINEKTLTEDSVKKLQKQIDDIAQLQDAVNEYEQIQAERIDTEANQRRIFSPWLYIPSIGLLAAGAVALFLHLLIGLVLLLCSLPFLAYLIKTYFHYQKAEPHLNQLRKREQELSEQVTQYRSKDFLENQLRDQNQRTQQLTGNITKMTKQIHSQLTNLSPELIKKKAIPKETDIDGIQTTIESIEQTLLELQAKREGLTEQLASIETQLEDVKQLEQDLTRAEKELTYLQEQLSTYELPKLPPDLDQYSEALYEELDEQVKTLGQEKAAKQANRQTTSQRINELSTFLKENEGVIAQFEQKEKEVMLLKETVQTGQMTIDLIREVAERGREQVRPRVVNVMGRLLASITGGKYRFPKLSEDYSLKVYSAPAGEYVQAALYSGGTEDQFLLALRLAFAIALLPQGRGTAPQFLLLDEPFAGSDIQRRDNIIRLLQDELSRTFQQIIVVSHQPAVLAVSEHQFRMANGHIIHSE